MCEREKENFMMGIIDREAYADTFKRYLPDIVRSIWSIYVHLIRLSGYKFV